MSNRTETTDLLLLVARGEPQSEEELIGRIYAELRALARRELGRWEDHGLDSTALVHELYLRLLRSNKPEWRGRRHLLNAFAQAMHLFMIDVHRRKVAFRASDTASRELQEEREQPDAVDLVELRQGLEELAALAHRAAEALRARYFLGLTVDEVAREFGVSPATVERDLAYARAWLHRRLTR